MSSMNKWVAIIIGALVVAWKTKPLDDLLLTLLQRKLMGSYHEGVIGNIARVVTDPLLRQALTIQDYKVFKVARDINQNLVAFGLFGSWILFC